MIAESINYLEAINQLPPDTLLIRHDVPWEEYEEILDQVGEATWLRISYDDGTLQIMTVGSKHEKYATFIESLVGAVRLRLRLNILFFGSSTMRKAKKRKGTEPDACFYVQTAAALGRRLDLDFAVDPPPDVVVEVDLHSDSISKFPIYAGLGVPEIWLYDGRDLTIHLLESEQYVPATQSNALPLLSGPLLTKYLTAMREEGEFETILAFDEWLQTREQ
jgi:Uma2 family endonuclease